MAKSKDKADKADTSGNARFQIRTPNPTFAGERCGVKFRDGAATTTDAKIAAGLAGLGYQVVDVEAGTTVNPLVKTDAMAGDETKAEKSEQ